MTRRPTTPALVDPGRFTCFMRSTRRRSADGGATGYHHHGLDIEVSGSLWREDALSLPVDTGLAVSKGNEGNVAGEAECEPLIAEIERAIAIAVHEPCAISIDTNAILAVMAPFCDDRYITLEAESENRSLRSNAILPLISIAHSPCRKTASLVFPSPAQSPGAAISPGSPKENTPSPPS